MRKRRFAECDGRDSILRMQIGREALECQRRRRRDRALYQPEQLFGLVVGERQRLVVIRLCRHAGLDQLYATPIGNSWQAIRGSDRKEMCPPGVLGHADYDWSFFGHPSEYPLFFRVRGSRHYIGTR